MPEPFLPQWNFRVLQELFHFFPHSGTRDTVAQFLAENALASTWIYGAVFYLYWRIEDERTVWRRTRLLEIFLTLCIVLMATFAFRPWVGWPAPSLVPHFRELYPTYFWNDGNPNCFPSHSTLIYFLVAAGFWPFKRWLSALLMLLVLLLISLPRLYVGGHYPVDVLVAILLAGLGISVTRRIGVSRRVSVALIQNASKGIPAETLLFLWLFELANGFRSSYWIAKCLARIVRNILR